MNYKHIIIVVLAGLLWSSCNIINPAEKTPTYVYIDTFSFMPKENTQGSTHNITSAWVYYNNNPVGVFDLPAQVPIQATGHGSLDLAPGVPIDGVYSLMSQYKYYAFDTGSIDAAPGQVVHRSPKTSYTAVGTDVKFPWKEGFEGQNSFIHLSGFDSIIAINKNFTIPGYTGTTDSKVLDGVGAGLIMMNGPNGDTSENITQQSYTISGGPAFCELDYNSNVPFFVGLVPVVNGNPVVSSPYYIVGVNPNGGGVWTKMYVSLGDYVAKYLLLSTASTLTFNVCVKAILPNGQANGFVLLDNMKLVTCASCN